MNNVPALPKIDGDLMLDVFTHRSWAPSRFTSEQHGNTERLAQLGADVLRLVVTWCLYAERPMLDGPEMIKKREELLSDDKIESWVSVYRLKDKVRGAQPGVLDTAEEGKFLFHSYVGAVYTSKGINEVYGWIARFIYPDGDLPALPGGMGHMPFARPTGANSIHSDVPQPSTYAAPPASAPPPLPGASASAAGPFITLALFNQTAIQHGLAVSWQADSTGQSHNPTWTVHCIVNGEERGCGVGKSQKIAKDDAARKAYVSLFSQPA